MLFQAPIPPQFPSVQNLTDLVQIAGIIWAAAKLHSSVKMVESTANELKTSFQKMADTIGVHGERIAKLEGRQDE